MKLSARRFRLAPLRVCLLVVAAVTAAAAPAPQAGGAAKPAGKAPAKAAAKPATGPAGAFDPTNPQALADVLSAAGAQVQTSRREADSVFMTVAQTTAAPAFSLQFAGCSPQGRSCKAVLMDAAMGRNTATPAQLNGFIQSSVTCRIYQDRSNMAHVVYSALLTPGLRRDDLSTHILAWQGCLGDSREFLADPAGYLTDAA